MRRPLVLTGFMGTGKTTVGAATAARAGARFVCLDEALTARAGKPIASIFRDEGEAAFRAREEALLRELLLDAGRSSPRQGLVVAAGGGALLRRTLRLEVLDACVVVCLEASLAAVAERLARPGAPQRPLGDPAGLAALLEQRAPAYAEAHARLSTDERSPEELARMLVALWKRDPLVVAAGPWSYRVEVGEGTLAERLAEAAEGAPVALVVTDANVAPLHLASALEALGGSGRRVASCVLLAGEAEKRPETLSVIWRAAQDAGADRRSLFVGLGGGVVTDLTGFAAATWQRGVRWLSVPTTLLGAVDASIGGKTGVDFGDAKNAVGAFWQPSEVVCDTQLVATEGLRSRRSALAEVVKTALVGDPGLLDLLERTPLEALGLGSADAESGVGTDCRALGEVVRRCARVKARIVSRDEREGGERAVLNLGHTVGHALEAWGHFARWTHGEAVSLGLVAALRLGVARGVTREALAERALSLLARFGLPTVLDVAAPGAGEAVAALLGHDKKRDGAALGLVLVAEPGDVRVIPTPIPVLRGEVAALWPETSREA